MKPMMNCSDDSLRLLLREDEQSGDYRDAARHVDSCPHCQQRIGELAAEDDEWQEAHEMLLAGDESGTGTIDRLSAHGRSRGRWQRQPTAWTEAMARQLLSPPSHPEMLGRIGRYEVERLIGTGGMGVVFKAFDSELNRPVAVKLLTPYLAGSGAARKRFAREARAAAAVVHEHVVAIHNVETDGEVPFLVMQYVPGESLQGRLDREGPLGICEILRIGTQIASGLAAAHAQGLVHRDVKPSNVLLEKGVERSLLTDFGLARAGDDAGLMLTGHHPGTPQYMSPEQARGEALDGRSDLFSLGCVLYEMATGVSPFRTDSTMATLRRIVDEQPAAMASLVPELPPWFSHIVERLLSKDPAQRFASASEVSQLLEQCLSHLQQPTSVPLPAFPAAQVSGGRSPFDEAKEPMKTNSITDALFIVLRLFGDLLLGRGITAGWPQPVRPKPKCCLPLWAMIILPVWFFCYGTVIHTGFEILGLFGNVEVQNQKLQEIGRVLGSSFTAFLFGLLAAQFSVAVTPRRFLRPLMSLWVMSPYFFARKSAYLVAVSVGHVIDRVPPTLTDEEIRAYLVIAVFSAIIYSYVIRREPSQSPPTQPQNDPLKGAAKSVPHEQQTAPLSDNPPAPHATGHRSILNATQIGVIAMLGTIGMTLLGMVLWQKVPEAQSSTDKAARTTANQLDEKATGKQLGTVLGKPILEGDLNKDVSTEDNLKRLLLRPLMENYCRKLGLDRAAELNAKIKDEQSRRIASFFVLPAELNRHLFEKHGGRVILSASGAVAIDGMRKWLEAREQAGDFQITDPQLKRVFRELWVQEPIADAQFATQEEIKAAFDPDQIEYFVKREGIFNRGSERLPVDEITRMIDSIKNNTNGAKAAKRWPGITALRFGDGVDRESRQAWVEWWDREKANIDNAAAGVREFIVNGRITDPEGKPIAGATVRVHVPSKSSPTGHYQLAHTISDSCGEYVLQFGIPPFAAKEESTWQATFTALNPPRFVAHEDYLKFVKTVHRQLPKGKGTDTDYGDPVIFVGTPMPMNFKLRPASIGPDPVDADASPKTGQPEPQKRENKLPEETPDANNAQSRTKPDRGPTTQFAIGNVLYSLPFDFPSLESILRSIPEAKARPKNERIQCELVKYQVSNARHYPLVGPAQLVEAHFKSTLTSDAGREVVFSDTSHLIRN